MNNFHEICRRFDDNLVNRLSDRPSCRHNQSRLQYRHMYTHINILKPQLSRKLSKLFHTSSNDNKKNEQETCHTKQQQHIERVSEWERTLPMSCQMCSVMWGHIGDRISAWYSINWKTSSECMPAGSNSRYLSRAAWQVQDTDDIIKECNDKKVGNSK